jgi:F420H(2)-dependent quinone reductase
MTTTPGHGAGPARLRSHLTAETPLCTVLRTNSRTTGRSAARVRQRPPSESQEMRIAPSAAFQLPYLRLHEAMYRASRGWVGKHAGGRPALLLTTKGRRSGIPRTVALIYARHGNDLIVVASNGGSSRHPGWYLNLRSDPQVTVQIGRRRSDATARVVEGSEREELWKIANKNNRGLAPLFHSGASGRYDSYQRHTARSIPVVVLTPGAWRLPRDRGISDSGPRWRDDAPSHRQAAGGGIQHHRWR